MNTATSTATMSTAALTAVPAHRRLRASTAALITGHRERFAAGVPGCSCGIDFDCPHQLLPVRHAAHLGDVVIAHILAAAVAAIREAGTPDEAAVSAVADMVRHESRTTKGTP